MSFWICDNCVPMDARCGSVSVPVAACVVSVLALLMSLTICDIAESASCRLAVARLAVAVSTVAVLSCNCRMRICAAASGLADAVAYWLPLLIELSTALTWACNDESCCAAVA